jgi:hypothetical protein
VLKYLDRYIEVFSELHHDADTPDPKPCSVNLAVEVGGSDLVVVDADTVAQRRRFLGAWQGDPDSQVPPTILSPGTRGPDGQWIHEPGNGHYWFTTKDLDYEWAPPTNMGAYTVPGDDGFAVLWDRRYVLIPPSRRPEGAYETLGRDYPLPQWLADAITDASKRKQGRVIDREIGSYANASGPIAGSIDAWAAGVSWHESFPDTGCYWPRSWGGAQAAIRLSAANTSSFSLMGMPDASVS